MWWSTIWQQCVEGKKVKMSWKKVWLMMHPRLLVKKYNPFFLQRPNSDDENIHASVWRKKSSLQHNILHSFCCALVLWNLLFYSRLSICDVIAIIRKSYYSCCVGGVSPHTFIDLHVERHFESILHPVQSISKRMKYLPFFRWRHEEKESNI